MSPKASICRAFTPHQEIRSLSVRDNPPSCCQKFLAWFAACLHAFLPVYTDAQHPVLAPQLVHTSAFQAKAEAAGWYQADQQSCPCSSGDVHKLHQVGLAHLLVPSSIDDVLVQIAVAEAGLGSADRVRHCCETGDTLALYGPQQARLGTDNEGALAVDHQHGPGRVGSCKLQNELHRDLAALGRCVAAPSQRERAAHVSAWTWNAYLKGMHMSWLNR